MSTKEKLFEKNNLTRKSNQMDRREKSETNNVHLSNESKLCGIHQKGN